ncbi:PSP-domain-containing protein [Lactarius quietus]|nr:PSP-domain-containing protein [Lactarius quietus]
MRKRAVACITRVKIVKISEFETSLNEKRPGDLSSELVEALSIPPLAPTPWLISMQRFGPPPSYPTLRIPGLNAPIPEGHTRNGVSIPVDGETHHWTSVIVGEPVDKNLWGELEPEEGRGGGEEEATESAPTDGMQTSSGLAVPSGMASVVSTVAAGLETPDFLELRKTTTAPVRGEGGNRQLYSVLPEMQTSVRGLMGSEREYDVSGVSGATVPVLREERGTKRKAGGVDVSLDASELEGLSEDELRRRYDAQSRGSAGVPGQGPGREDFSEMVAKEMAKKRQKMEADRERGKKDKSGRDFKLQNVNAVRGSTSTCL